MMTERKIFNCLFNFRNGFVKRRIHCCYLDFLQVKDTKECASNHVHFLVIITKRHSSKFKQNKCIFFSNKFSSTNFNSLLDCCAFFCHL